MSSTLRLLVSRHNLWNSILPNCIPVPAIIYIDKWGRRPMLLFGTIFMGFWLYLVGGLQGRFGHWGEIDGSGQCLYMLLANWIQKISLAVWIISDNDAATKAIIVCSYLFVCRYINHQPSMLQFHWVLPQFRYYHGSCILDVPCRTGNSSSMH